MNTRNPLIPLSAAIGTAALLFCACTKTDNTTKLEQDAKAAVADVKAAASDSWDSIKDFTYERRADFSAAMDRMTKDMDEKTDALKAKMAGVQDSASKDRESAMKEYDEARADLRVRLTELGNATSDTWADAKAKADEAWKRVQAAYDRVTKANASP
jgi:hypothetical protein